MPTLDEIISRWLPHYTHHQFADEVRALSVHGEKWLYRQGQPGELWQGDVLPGLPFLSVGAGDEVTVALTWGMVLSNTCDLVIGQDEYAVIASILSFAEHLRANPLAGDAIRDFHRSLRQNIIWRYFYLPAFGRLPESFADFSRPTAIELPALYERLAVTELTDHLSLSLKGHLLLLMKLAHHIASGDAGSDLHIISLPLGQERRRFLIPFALTKIMTSGRETAIRNPKSSIRIPPSAGPPSAGPPSAIGISGNSMVRATRCQRILSSWPRMKRISQVREDLTFSSYARKTDYESPTSGCQ